MPVSAYIRRYLNWVNWPSKATPVSAFDLDHFEDTFVAHADELIDLDARATTVEGSASSLGGRLDTAETDIEHATTVFNAKASGAVGDGMADDTAAITAALSAAASDGGTVFFPPGDYLTTGGHTVPANVWIEGAPGSTVWHSGNNVCFLFTGMDTVGGWGIRRLRIFGDSGTVANAIELRDVYRVVLEDVQVHGYSGTGGVGVYFHNTHATTGWTEGCVLDRVDIRNCKTCIRFQKETSANSNSFGYNRLRDFRFSLEGAQTGIDFGGANVDDGFFYSGEISGNIWATGNNNVALDGKSLFQLLRTLVWIRGEQSGGTGNVRLKNRGLFVAHGGLNFDGTWTDDLTGGLARVTASHRSGPDNMSGAAGAETFQAWLLGDSENSHLAGFGRIFGTNLDMPYVQMFNSAGNAFRVYAVNFGANPGDDGVKVFEVTQAGAIRPQAHKGVAIILQGTGSPEGVEIADPGSLYMRDNGELWLKTSGTGSIGWTMK